MNLQNTFKFAQDLANHPEKRKKPPPEQEFAMMA
jgi:hypothetical protein